jgi:hypothetical protein
VTSQNVENDICTMVWHLSKLTTVDKNVTFEAFWSHPSTGDVSKTCQNDSNLSQENLNTALTSPEPPPLSGVMSKTGQNDQNLTCNIGHQPSKLTKKWSFWSLFRPSIEPWQCQMSKMACVQWFEKCQFWHVKIQRSKMTTLELSKGRLAVKNSQKWLKNESQTHKHKGQSDQHKHHRLVTAQKHLKTGHFGQINKKTR